MATKNFRSTVLEPTSEFAHGDKLRFTALATVGEVLKGSFSETTIGEDGVYSVDLQYGKHRIDYKPYEGVWRHFADVEVNADTLATTLQDLALASVPVTDEAVLVLQGILADAEAAKTAAETAEAAAEAALASIDTTILDAKAGYPDVVKAMFNVAMHVDNVNGDDSRSGSTLATAKKTIKSAIESTPVGCVINITLAATEQKYMIDADISTENKIVFFKSASGNQQIEQMQNTLVDYYASFGFKMSDSSVISFSGCKVITAKMTVEKLGLFENYRNALFVPLSAYNASVKILSSDVEINNSPLCHVHGSGSMEGAVDIYMSVVRLLAPALSFDTGSRLISSVHSSIAFPQKIITYGVENLSGIAWSDLISANSMLQTNIIMTVSKNGAEYINIDERVADDVGISATDFDAALAEQQASELFKTEKSIALQIMADFNLGTGEQEITGADIADVRAYIQSIDPAKGLKAGHLQRAKIPRPSIFDRYS